jgi:hypothetical protein
MRGWTDQEVIRKLDDGWRLNGDWGTETPFVLYDPLSERGFDSNQTVPAELVRSVRDRLQPEPAPGRVISYRSK